MRRVWVGVVAAALCCAGCSDDDPAPVEITTTDSAGRTSVVTQEVTEEPPAATDAGEGPGAEPVATALVTTQLEGPDGTTYEVELPETWTVQELAAAERTAAPDQSAVPPAQWCLVPPSGPPTIDGCAGVLLAAGPDWLPGHAGSAYSLRQVDGWRSTDGPLACPVDQDGEPTDAAVVTATPDEDSVEDAVAATAEPDASEVDLLITASEGMPLTSVESEVNGRTLTYETWRASCSISENVVISPQVWHDRDLGVLIRDYVGLPETIAIVESLRTA